MGGVQNKQIYKSESKLVVAYGYGVEWECGRVTDYTWIQRFFGAWWRLKIVLD